MQDMDKYVEYYHDNYIRKISHNGKVGKPLFAHELWNQFDNVIKSIPATNNSVEAWNGAWIVLNQAIPVYGPPLTCSGGRMG